MPCNTVTTQSVALAKAMSSLVVETLLGLGWIVTEATSTKIAAYYMGTNLTWNWGKGLSVQAANAQQIITKVTKAYSVKAVSWAAQKAGWAVTQTAENKITASRR